MKDSYSSLWRKGSGQRVALFGHREALVALFDHQLPFREHVKESIMTSAQVDVIVIGAGPAGVLAAFRAAALGARTVLVAKGPYVIVRTKGTRRGRQ